MRPCSRAVDAQVGAKECRVALGAIAIAVRRDIAREKMETESARIISRAFGYLGYGMALQLLCRARCARALTVGASQCGRPRDGLNTAYSLELPCAVRHRS
jgi:hypothetical protein